MKYTFLSESASKVWLVDGNLKPAMGHVYEANWAKEQTQNKLVRKKTDMSVWHIIDAC